MAVKIKILSYRHMAAGLLEETFELIKSLDKSEKRYFSLFSRFQGGSKSYIKLFNLMDGLKVFDEAEIKQRFLKQNRITNFPAVKKYLFDQLIAALKSYGAYKDLDSDHTEMIETYKLLQYKGLHVQSGKLLQKIKAITLQDDAFIRNFYVMLQEYLREMFSSHNPNPDKVYKILEEKKRVLDIINNYTFIGDLFSYQRLYLRQKLYCRNQKEKEELTRLMAPVLQSKESDMLSRTALAMRSMGLCDYYTAIGEPEKAILHSKTYLNLRQAAVSDKIDTTTLSEHAGHIWLCLRSGILEGVEDNLQKFKAMIEPIRNRQKFMMGYERWHNYTFIFLIRKNEYEKALAFVESEMKTMPGYQEDFSFKAKTLHWYFTAYLHFLRKDFTPALKWVQEIQSQANDGIEEFHFSKLLIMFIHYDLKNYELVGYQVRSYARLIAKTKRQYKCESLILGFFKTIAAKDSIQVRIGQLENLQTRIAAAFKVHFERGFLFYFDINNWIGTQLLLLQAAHSGKRRN